MSDSPKSNDIDAGKLKDNMLLLNGENKFECKNNNEDEDFPLIPKESTILNKEGITAREVDSKKIN